MIAAPEINGDLRLGFADRLKYIWSNFRRNLTRRPPSVNTRSWQPPADTNLGIFSPGRCLTEAFIKVQLPTILPPQALRVLDVGCGSGRTSNLLATAGYSGHYTGVDVDDRFDAKDASSDAFDRTFIHGDAHDLSDLDPFDLIISISALEHVDNDAALIDHLGTMQADGGYQIHFVPAPAGLPVYLWHGFRQYSLQAIAQRFGQDDVEVYRLGGLASFLLHLVVITLPEILLSTSLRKRWPAQYRFLLAKCLRWDRWIPVLPVCHVVCCHSRKTAD
ncbi:MAG: class I SAM-dependent methyltransferase [Alphaproteobacteria bacterium]|nr:class I SAM-dependent methyltransferase [Alphaproteobacteria bacterium]